MLNNIARIQRALTQAHLDAILLTDENDRRFATGFPSSDGAVIVTVHQAFFITDARYIEAARAALTGIAQVLLCSREAPMRTLVQGILREANVQILGGEEQTTSYAEFTAYEQLFGLKLQPAQNLIRNLRAANVSGAADHGRDVRADLHRHPPRHDRARDRGRAHLPHAASRRRGHEL